MTAKITGFAADPYYFNNSKHFDKQDFINKDVQQIIHFFGKTENQIYDASKSYIGREERLFNFISSIKFWRNAIEVQLTEKSTNLSTLVALFVTEAIVGDQVDKNGDRFRSFIHSYLTKEQKIELLSGYTFGQPYLVGLGGPRKKHLCHRAVILSGTGKYTNRSFCSSGPVPICGCRDWLNGQPETKINRYLNMFATYFYRMRNSVVHDAGFVMFTSMPFEDKDIGTVVPTTADAFSNNSLKTYTSYDTDVTVQRFQEIMKDAAWRCFENGSTVKKIKQAELLKRL